MFADEWLIRNQEDAETCPDRLTVSRESDARNTQGRSVGSRNPLASLVLPHWKQFGSSLAFRLVEEIAQECLGENLPSVIEEET